MITQLSYTIHGNNKRISKAAEHFMQQMSKIFNKEINGMTLIGLERKDLKINIKTYKKKEIESMFKPLTKHKYE